MTNPFVAFWHDPVAVLTALAYALLLLALSVGFVAAITQTVVRAWKQTVYLSNAWEWRDHAEANGGKFGPAWEWYYPPRNVLNAVSMVAAWVALSFGVAALLLWALSAVGYVLGSI